MKNVEAINRAYRRVQLKLDELNIPYFISQDTISISAPIDKLPTIEKLLKKETSYLEYDIKR